MNGSLTLEELISTLEKVLPTVLWRHRWQEYRNLFGVPFARGTMQNRDSEKRGPIAGKVGKRVFYRREDFLEWLSGQE